ncbi:hypothetical protein PENTCL1PPCAC_651, partial [Pristionchus entomophagus]
FFFNLGVQQSRVVLLSQHLATKQKQQLQSSAATPTVPAPSTLQQMLAIPAMMQQMQRTSAVAPAMQQQLSALSIGSLAPLISHQPMIPAANQAAMNLMQPGNLLLIKRSSAQPSAFSTMSSTSSPSITHLQSGFLNSMKLSEAPIMAKSTPDIIVVPPTSHNSVSCNVSGFIPLTPQQQAAIDRKHQELTTATTSPSGRNSSRPSGSSPSRVDEQGSIDCESPPV